VPLEAMASGTPVIAYWKWWALETVVDNKTGIFFHEQSVQSLNETIEKFESLSFDSKIIRKHAENFDKEIFKKNLISFIEDKLEN
jgi:glycosyltransferase involved in cell wall biosynthesis